MRNRRLVQSILAGLVLAGLTLPARALDAPALRRPCDPLDKALCLLPFPNDRFTVADASTATGRRIDLLPAEMPRSVAGKPIDPTEWNRNDGFSPGSMVLTFVPGLDLHATWGTTALSTGGPNDPADHLADIARYAADDAPMLIIDTATGERWPFWSELDHNAATTDAERMLILRPAINFLEGHTYAVALRNLRASDGSIIRANPQFAAYRDGTPGPVDDPTFEEERRAEVNAVIDSVAAAEASRGFDRSDLYLAWKFTIASERNLSERVLHIRNDALSKLNGGAPSFTITKVTPRTDGARVRQVEGTISVPNYIDRPPQAVIEKDPVAGLPGQAVGGRFLYGLDGKPMQNPVFPTVDVPFVCTIPKPNVEYDDGPAHPTLYGHGLLGNRSESTGGSTDRIRERNFMPCATQWMGFADYDIGNAVVTLADPSNMPTMADRAQQGFLNWIYLSRAIVHANGFASHSSFQDAGGVPLFRAGELVYDGNSQGGIMGGAVCALSVDLTRCVLGVTGMNYSTLLNRSVDWEGPLVNPEDVLPSYSSVLYTMFPDKREQQLVIGLLQMLWDRAEANGYAQHMTTDPLPGTPAHQVLMHVALGDFQVTNFSADVEARTIGARFMDTAFLPGRHWSVDPSFGLTPFDHDCTGDPAPCNPSALVYWDSGNLLPPNANVPPAEDGGDPHEDPRRDPRSGDQKRIFWLTGDVVDVFNGGPYLLCRPGQENNIPRVPSLFTQDWC